MTSRDEAPGEAAPQAGGLRYLIARHENNRLELLTLAATPRGEVLPVFGTEGPPAISWEAAASVAAGGSGGRQQASLSRSCSVTWPTWRASPWIPPGPPDAGLRGTSKKEFIDALVGEPLAPHPR